MKKVVNFWNRHKKLHSWLAADVCLTVYVLFCLRRTRRFWDCTLRRGMTGS